jgi:photosystem II stability/assembly factor-like uncharacterized protein
VKAPVDLLWLVVGDIFGRILKERGRRTAESFWQALTDLSGDAVAYQDWIANARNIFEVESTAPYGTFRIEPREVSNSSAFPAIMIGGRPESFWSWFLWTDTDLLTPDSGHFSLDLTSLPFGSSVDVPLDSGGRIIKLSGQSNVVGQAIEDTWEESQNPSTLFDAQTVIDGSGRWRDKSQSDILPDEKGLFFNPIGLDWHILKDQFYFDAAATWRQVYKFSVTEWDEAVTLRSLALQSFSDVSGEGFELRLSENGGVFSAQAGFIGGSLVTLEGDTSGWRAILQSATVESPVDLEFVLRYDALQSSLWGAVWLRGEQVSMLNTQPVSPGRRTHIFDFFNEVGNTAGFLEMVVATAGVLWNTETPFDLNSLVSPNFAFTYQVEDPLVGSKLLKYRPWDLAATATLIDDSFPTIVVDIDESFFEYAPEFARIVDGTNFWIATRTDLVGRRATYEVAIRNNPLAVFPQRLKIHPWFVDDGEHEWSSPGVVGTQFAIPFEAGWTTETRAIELDMYGRYGRILKAQQKEDSERYLSALRGMQIGRWGDPTVDNMENALNVFLGLPFVVNGGFINSIERIKDSLGRTLRDEVTIGNRIYDVDPFWDNAGLLTEEGQFVDSNATLVTGAKIVDWFQNAELVRLRTSNYKQWRTFIVEIPGDVGLSLSYAADLFTLLDVSKKKTTTYIVDFTVDVDENFSGLDEHIVCSCPSSNAHTIEDTMFGDGGEVVTHPDDPNRHFWDTEVQVDEPHTLGGGGLDQGLALGSVLNWVPFHRLEIGTSISQLQALPYDYWTGDNAVDLNRDTTTAEEEFTDVNGTLSGFSRPSLRAKDRVLGTRTITPKKPNTLLFLTQVSQCEVLSNINILIDTSSTSPVAGIITGLDAFADANAANGRFSVDEYSGSSCTPLTQLLALPVAPATHTNVTLKASWSALSASGSRPTGGALEEILDNTETRVEEAADADGFRRDKFVVLISNGAKDACANDPIAEAARYEARGYYVYVISIGGPITELTSIATAGRTTVVDITTPATELQAALEGILDDVRERQLIFHEQTFVEQTSPAAETWHGVQVVDFDDVEICGTNGKFYRSADYGENWADDSPVTAETLRAIRSNWVVGDNKASFKYAAGWSADQALVIDASADSPDLLDIDWFDASDGSIVGHDGVDGYLYWTNDSGASWGKEKRVANLLHGHAQPGSDLYYVAAADGLWTFTGAVWTKVFDTTTLFYELRDVAVCGNTIIACGTEGRVVLSTDGGATFSDSQVSLTPGDTIRRAACVSERRLTVISSFDGRVYRSNDSGATWTEVLNSANPLFGLDSKAPWYNVAVGTEIQTWR